MDSATAILCMTRKF